jgi:RimJ/RimL family protein N-acetyltransferase
MATELVLRDGTPAYVWPMLPSDRAATAAYYEALGDLSKYHRFLSSVPRLSNQQLTHLVDDVDGVDHVALVLFVFDDEHHSEPAGVARMIRYAGDPTAADVAVTIREPFRGRGAATALLDQLLVERPVGVSRLLTQVAVGNPAALRMLQRLGPTTVRLAGPGAYEVEVELPDAHDQ